MKHSQSSEIQSPKVSVIVPVYNTELYVERAIISLMEQTLQDVQFIIIDDGSKDNSLNIIRQVIARYPVREGQVTLISRENLGVAATRAQGMELATGDYVIHLDSDDWAEHNWLQTMYNKAIENNADVTVCDYYNVFNSGLESVKQDVKNTPVGCLKSLLLGRISNSNWNKLVSRELFIKNNINFHERYNTGEDLLVSFFVFINAKNVTYINESLYYYNNVNSQSITKMYTHKHLRDLVQITELMELEIRRFFLFKEVSSELLFFKLNLKAFIIRSSAGDMDVIHYAFNVFEGENKFILSSNIRFLKLIYLLKKVNILFLAPSLISLRRFVLERISS